MSIRSPLIRALKCIACELDGAPQPFASEEHHLNLGGKAGQKRRGDSFSIPLCRWHHRGVQLDGATRGTMRILYGPSLALSSKAFRVRYGSDDELLEKTNRKLIRGEAA